MTNNSIGNIKGYTPKFKLIIPRFNAATWHDFIESNFRSIDALLYNMFGINNFVGEWKQITTYNVGDVVFIGEDLLENETNSEYSGRLVKVLVQHTTDNSNYFNIFYEDHPDYYELFFDANNAEYFSEQAFGYKNEANSYLQASQELNALYQQYLADTQTARDNAQTSANSAATSEQNARTARDTAVNTVQTATNLLNSTQDYTNQAINTINTTKTEAVNTITTTKEQTIQEIETKLEETNEIIDEKITTAQDNLDTTITEAIVDAKDEVQEEANKAIENAAQEAADFAKNILDDYVTDTVEPSLQHFVDEAETAQDNAIIAQNNAQTSATASATSATNALSSENNAKTSENNAESYYNSAKTQADLAKNSADLAQDALKSITGVYRVKGSVASYTNLPISGDVGDVYNVLDTGSNYVWTEDGWDKLSETIDVSWGSISGTLSNQSDLQQALDSKVDLTNNQTINGIKTLTETVVGLCAPINFIAQNNNIEKGVTPASNQYCGYDLRGKSGVRLAYLGIAYLAGGRKFVDLQKLDTNLEYLNCQLPIKTPTPATGENSTTVPTTAWIRSLFAKLDLNNVFTADQKLAKSNPIYVLDATGGTYGEIQTRKAGVRTGGFRNIEESGANQTYMYVTSEDGTTIQGAIGILFDGTNTYTKAPTPVTSDNSTKIATTAWFRNNMQVVTALPSSPTAGVFYFIKE